MKANRITTAQENRVISNGAGADGATSVFLAHLAWALGGLALVWSAAIWVGLTNSKPTSFAFFKDLNYSATIIHGLWVLGLLLVALNVVLHMYRRHALDGERLPGQLGPFVIPPPLRWLRILFFLAITAVPTATQIFMCARMFAALEIIHYGGSKDDTDTKRGIDLVRDFGSTSRGEERSIFRGWYWHSHRDRPDGTPNTRGIDAWPGVQPLLYIATTLALACSFLYLIFAQSRMRKSAWNRIKSHATTQMIYRWILSMSKRLARAHRRR